MAEDEGGAKPIADTGAERRWELALWLAVRQTPPRELSHGAKLCWDVIARWEWNGMECWAGLLRMGHELGVTEGQASRYLDQLIRRGYVHKTIGSKGKPIYQRLTSPDLHARAEKVYQETWARAQKDGNG